MVEGMSLLSLSSFPVSSFPSLWFFFPRFLSVPPFLVWFLSVGLKKVQRYFPSLSLSLVSSSFLWFSSDELTLSTGGRDKSLVLVGGEKRKRSKRVASRCGKGKKGWSDWKVEKDGKSPEEEKKE